MFGLVLVVKCIYTIIFYSLFFVFSQCDARTVVETSATVDRR